jgi:hypothetical protein
MLTAMLREALDVLAASSPELGALQGVPPARLSKDFTCGEFCQDRLPRGGLSKSWILSVISVTGGGFLLSAETRRLLHSPGSSSRSAWLNA